MSGCRKMKNEILFSKPFDKLKDKGLGGFVHRAVLLDAHEIEKVSAQFLLYDLSVDGLTPNLENFDSYRNYIILIFLGKNGSVFTTLRKANQENRLKYFKTIGEDYVIKIQG